MIYWYFLVIFAGASSLSDRSLKSGWVSIGKQVEIKWHARNNYQWSTKTKRYKRFRRYPGQLLFRKYQDLINTNIENLVVNLWLNEIKEGVSVFSKSTACSTVMMHQVWYFLICLRIEDGVDFHIHLNYDEISQKNRVIPGTPLRVSKIRFEAHNTLE